MPGTTTPFLDKETQEPSSWAPNPTACEPGQWVRTQHRLAAKPAQLGSGFCPVCSLWRGTDAHLSWPVLLL